MICKFLSTPTPSTAGTLNNCLWRTPPLRELEAHYTTRKAMRAFEEALPPRQRKQLGQYFTGLPLGKLLTHLALRSDTRSVLDPMAGHGDLLDAAWEAAAERGISLDCLA